MQIKDNKDTMSNKHILDDKEHFEQLNRILEETEQDLQRLWEKIDKS